MVVQHNISAMTANRYYGVNNKGLASSLEKLASGYAINKAGDNAAGLAVSEKMRAQIGGLTQASKNAEDGISMVQTFEGALQETDSILQRMRTLAVQSANGSYQNDVDRDAIQLEFDQLNDELNQIADTDFNGTVMLNGGVMADGVHADATGKIDYANKKDQVTDATGKALQSILEKSKADYNKAKVNYEAGKYDLSSNGDAAEWNTVDNSQYTKTAADTLWAGLGITADGTVSSTATDADTSKADKISVTFKYNDTTKSWAAESGTKYLNGEEVGTIDKTVLQNAIKTNAITGTPLDDNNGGFTAGSTATKSDYGKAIFDASTVADGSTVTLVYTNGAVTKQAPENVGFKEDSVKATNTATPTPANTLKADGTTIAVNASLTDANMSEDVKNALDALNGMDFKLTYADLTTDAAKDVTLEIGNKTGTAAIDLHTATTGEAVQIDSSGLSIKVSTAAADGTSGVVDFFSKDGVKLATLTAQAYAKSSGATAHDGTYGTVKGTIAVDSYAYSKVDTYDLTVGDDPNLESSGTLYGKMNDAKAAMDAAAEKLDKFNELDKTNAQDWESIKTMYAEAMSSSGKAVSISDNFDNSMAKMTYTDKMSLQVGARTKDVVNFTFDYVCDDLGGLEKNLNCSSREGGLETAKLSLRTQSDANDAIDKIDKALNKVNMVRATFGAVQNRLEHKINNIDTNTENLTAAESRIRDTQMDKEMMKFTSSQILSQASQSMLAQANQLPQGVLQLLG